jgi:hypothetical protein
MKNQFMRSIYSLLRLALVSAIVLSAGCVKTANTSSASSQERKPESQAAAPANVSNVATSVPSPAETPAAESATTIDPPEKVVKDFYTFYVTDKPEIDQKNRSKFAKYVTKRYMKEAQGDNDADPFLDVQDWDESYSHNFKATVVSSNDQKATVALVFTDKTDKWKLKVKLAKEDGAWKIDGVDDDNNH